MLSSAVSCGFVLLQFLGDVEREPAAGPRVELRVIEQFMLEDAIIDIAVDPAAKAVAGVQFRERGRALFWKQETGWEASVIAEDLWFSRGLDVSGVRDQIAIVGDDCQITLVDLADVRRSETIRPPIGEMYCVAFSSDGEAIAASGRHGLIWLGRYDEDSMAWRPWKVLDAHRGWTSALAFDATGKIIASAGRSTVKVRDLETDREEVLTLEGGAENSLTSVAIHENGQVVMVGGDRLRSEGDRREGVSLIWHVNGGRTISLDGHTDLICNVDIVSHAAIGVTASYDGTIRVWSLETGELLTMDRPTDKTIMTMKCDGRPPWCAVATGDGEVIVYEVIVSAE